jgi:hypothetical protein
MELVSPGNAPFLIAIFLMICIGAVEGLSLLIGGSLLAHLDAMLTPHLPDGADADVSDGVLGWLYIGRAPLLVLLIIFLVGFAVTGLLLQMAMVGLIGYPLPALLASAIALACAIPMVRGIGGFIARHFPKDQSSAISEASFVGRIAQLTAESASAGRPGQAKLTDEHGQPHYFLVEPDAADVSFARGDSILVVSRTSSSLFRAIPNPRPDLL